MIDAADSFSHGQVYVALSRCKSLEGLVLRAPLDARCMICDPTVRAFTDYAAEHRPDGALLAVRPKLITGGCCWNCSISRR